IARTYQTTVADITEANELPNPNNLVVGQSLVIPIVGHFYFVQQGDSLYSIGQKVGVPYQQLAAINQIPVNQPLQIGLRLYIPE
ncbi:LysM peptidoglycan-binding domain-containing protein, partial [Alkalihalophilus lindianensis]